MLVLTARLNIQETCIIEPELPTNAAIMQDSCIFAEFLCKAGLQASLFIGQQPRRIADSDTIFDPVEYRNRNVDRSCRLEFPLDFNRIKVIEAGRVGDIGFKVDLRFMIARQQSLMVSNGQQPQPQDFLTGFEDKTESLAFTIPQSYWVKSVLPSLSLNKIYLLEIPEGNTIIQEAWKYIETAEAAFRNWNSKEVFGNCREAGTLVDRLLKAKFGDDFTYNERWGRAYAKFTHMASLDLHLEDLKKSLKYPPDSIKTDKIDAEQLIIRTKTLVKYAGELLNE